MSSNRQWESHGGSALRLLLLLLVSLPAFWQLFAIVSTPHVVRWTCFSLPLCAAYMVRALLGTCGNVLHAWLCAGCALCRMQHCGASRITAKPSARLPSLQAVHYITPCRLHTALQLASNSAMCDRVLSAEGIEQPLAVLHGALTLVQ